MPKHVLVINDTEEILELFQQILEGEGGYKVTIGTYKPHIIEDIKQLKPDLIITDYIFGQEHMGQQLVQKLHMDRDTADVPVIICSGALRELREQEGVLMDKGI